MPITGQRRFHLACQDAARLCEEDEFESFTIALYPLLRAFGRIAPGRPFADIEVLQFFQPLLQFYAGKFANGEAGDFDVFKFIVDGSRFAGVKLPAGNSVVILAQQMNGRAKLGFLFLREPRKDVFDAAFDFGERSLISLR